MTQDLGNYGAPPRPFYVLANSLGTHSLWPAALDTPVGWPVVHGPALRSECLAFISRAPSPGDAALLASAA
ncbi:MbtH family NRPS accessory protein [Streptomyces sp. NPDC005828]|uniref:MbtH family NRPS accessory protein n=1 Tax=Streptomyces sp. NPDC005828 TaxID=3157071 RepID=UPI0033F54269